MLNTSCPRFVLSSSAAELEEELKKYVNTATVEAEYGDDVVEGSVLTLAHHGPRKENLPPCLYDGGPVDAEVVGLSHIDLDTLGGCLRIMFGKEDFLPESFWKLVGYVDTHGVHRVEEGVEKTGATKEDVDAMNAYWAWAQSLPRRKREGVVDVTEEIVKGIEILRLIADKEPLLMEKGKEMREKTEALERESFCQAIGGVVVRVSSSFVNHLYTHEGRVYKAVAAFNTVSGAVTLSLAEPIPGISCREAVQRLWGPLAGGHDGIAGSPRGERRSLEDLLMGATLIRGAIDRVESKI